MGLAILHWLLTTDTGLLARIGIGAAIFAALAITDLQRHGRAGRRWREYLFLLAVVLAAILYGFVNDSLAASISPEYFVYGKGIGPSGCLRWEACKVGIKAAFSAGLIIGVAMLFANNPRRGRRQLRYRELFGLLSGIILCAATGAGIGAAIGWFGGWNWMSGDLAAIWREGLFRPRPFMLVYGMNLGGYAGAAMGTVTVVAYILVERVK
jgi:hypothetical protein